MSSDLVETSNSHKLLHPTSKSSFHNVCKFLVHLMTNLVDLSYHGGLLEIGRTTERIRGSKLKHGHPVSLNDISTNKSDAFRNCFFHLLVVKREKIPICKFEEYKLKLRHNCSTSTLAAAGGGTKRKLPRVKTLSNHHSGFNRVSNPSFSHHDLINSKNLYFFPTLKDTKVNTQSTYSPSSLPLKYYL